MKVENVTYTKTEQNRNLNSRFKEYKDGDLDGMSSIFRYQPGTRWSQAANPLHEARVAAATELVADILLSRAPSWALKEALAPTHLSTLRALDAHYPGVFKIHEAYGVSDFPILLGDVLDRMLINRFNEFPQGWRQYISVSRPLRDLRLVRRIGMDGGAGQYAALANAEGLTYSKTLQEDPFSYTPDLFALGLALTYRQLFDDDLNAFDMVPDVLGRGGRRTIARAITNILFDTAGPIATFFNGGNGNVIASNPALSTASLGTGLGQLLGFTDADSEPILVEGVTLVYGPALHVTVQNIMNQLSVDVTDTGGTTAQTVRVNNWIVQNLTAVLDPYIPLIVTGGNGPSSWLLTANPTSGRPMAEIGFVNGFEQPRLYRKQPNSMQVGGGVDLLAGDFETMGTKYKGVVAFGLTVLEPTSAVGSNGSGS